MGRIAIPISVALALIGAGLWFLMPAPVPEDLAGALPLSPPRAEGRAVRITALGTSLTAGSTWPRRLEEALAACATGGVKVTALGSAGASSDWGREQVQRLSQLAPDMVLIEFSINDADLMDGVSLAQARENHLAILDALASLNPDARPVLMTMSPAFGSRGWVRPWLSDHEAGYRAMARERGIGLIDLAPLWQTVLRRAEDPWLLMPDGLHPTEEAVAAIALPVMVADLGQALDGCH